MSLTGQGNDPGFQKSFPPASEKVWPKGESAWSPCTCGLCELAPTTVRDK